MKKTLILGASDNPARYSFRAAHMLKNHGHEVVPVGTRKGEVAGMAIHTDRPQATEPRFAKRRRRIAAQRLHR